MGHATQAARKQARRAGQELGMRDLIADWKRWSSAKRLLAVALMLSLIGLPLRVLIAGALL
jgi:hypothetical protein